MKIQKVRSSVQVMNFHSLMNIAGAMENIEKVREYEDDIKNVIGNILNNEHLILDKHISNSFFEKTSSDKDVNFYITSNFGLCGNFNSSVIKYYTLNGKSYRNYVSGKKGIKKMQKSNDFHININDLQDVTIFEELVDLFFADEITGINIIYNKFITQDKNEFVVQQLLPFDRDELPEKKDVIGEADYIIECSFTKLLRDLITLYISDKVYIAHLSALATENAVRQQITTESLKKIDSEIVKWDLEQKKMRRMAKNDELMDMLIKGKSMEAKKEREREIRLQKLRG